MKSQHTNTQSFARMSHFQEVTLTVNPNSSTLWEFEAINPKIKFASVGQPVLSGQPLLIKHSYTSHHLATDEYFFK